MFIYEIYDSEKNYEIYDSEKNYERKRTQKLESLFFLYKFINDLRKHTHENEKSYQRHNARKISKGKLKYYQLEPKYKRNINICQYVYPKSVWLLLGMLYSLCTNIRQKFVCRQSQITDMHYNL